MTDNITVDVILGTVSGVALGASIFVVFFGFLTFIGSYVYEQKIPWEILAYLIVFACICVVLILSSALLLREINEPRSFEEVIMSIWRSEYSWGALVVSAALACFVCCCLFLVGPYEVAERILQVIPTPKQQANSSSHLEIQTDIPARLDRLPWGAFHTFIAVALGITWILNGLEVTLAANVTPALMNSLGLSITQVGLSHTAYVTGLVIGALFFGWATDQLGRKRLFFITLLVYLTFTALTGLCWDIKSLALFRFLAGTGIGGEYAAINSAIQELIPARFRGRTDLLISGTFWIGAGIGALGLTVLLNPNIINPELGWRFAFLIGAALALIVLFIRRRIPESPRWLMTHGRVNEAKAIVSRIEEKFNQLDSVERLPRIHLIGRRVTPLWEVVQTIFHVYPGRALVSFSLMSAQALVYNAAIFNFAVILQEYFNIPLANVGLYFLPIAAGNFLGPLVLGRLFDTFGRKEMITLTYAISGLLIALSGYLFMIGALSALTQSLAWMVIFFFASAAASAAYLTAGEIFPLEIRALAIAFFFALGTGIGAVGPFLLATLVGQEPKSLYLGFIVGSAAMIAAALIELIWGVAAERRPLEDVARPLTFAK
jgi:MFS family permease